MQPLNDEKCFVEADYKKCLKAHYLENDHHPEHFNSTEEMPLEARMELTCDLLGTVKGWASKQNKDLTIAECRAYIEANNWKNWKLAIIDNLPSPAKCIPRLKPRWCKMYPIEQLHLLKTGTEDLECVRDYLDDLIKHKNGVFKVWQEIVTNYDPQFKSIETRIQDHDLDKFKPYMICGYTKKYSLFFQPQQIMAHICIPYESGEDLIKKFSNIAISAVTCSKENANFVLVTPKNYYGIYGGLIYNLTLKQYSEKHYISDTIDDSLSIVWWNTYQPKFLGDVYALAVGERVAVTPSIYERLIWNPISKPNTVKSSYYGTNLDFVNPLSLSDSE